MDQAGVTNTEHDMVIHALKRHRSGQITDPDQLQALLDLCEAYECWDPFFKILKSNIEQAKTRRIEDFVRLAKAQYLNLEDIFATAETCAQAVHLLQLSYRQFVETFLPTLFSQDDFPAEATVMQAVAERFVSLKDQIAATERLCLLYEKKTFNEIQLNGSYTKLLELDPLNIKALRYFKLLFTQNYEWEKVVGMLRNLLVANKHARDVFRVGQELAAVLLYQLDRPSEALEVVAKYCEGSPLDTSTISFDAYQRLNDWEGCLKVLRECLISVSEADQRAHISYRIASLHEKLHDIPQAIVNYRKAVELAPEFMEALEQLVHLLIQKKDWAGAVEVMQNAIPALSDQTAKSLLSEAVQRLNEGYRHVSG